MDPQRAARGMRSIPAKAQGKALVTAVLVTGSVVLAGALALGVGLVIVLA